MSLCGTHHDCQDDCAPPGEPGASAPTHPHLHSWGGHWYLGDGGGTVEEASVKRKERHFRLTFDDEDWCLVVCDSSGGGR